VETVDERTGGRTRVEQEGLKAFRLAKHDGRHRLAHGDSHMFGIHSDEPSFRNVLPSKLAEKATIVKRRARDLHKRRRAFLHGQDLATRPGKVIAALQADQLDIAEIIFAQQVAAAARAALEGDC
jgi:hypothetical protein